MAEFVFVLGGVGYKQWHCTPDYCWADAALRGGVHASTFNWCSFRYTALDVTIADDGNTAVTMPPGACRWHWGW